MNHTELKDLAWKADDAGLPKVTISVGQAWKLYEGYDRKRVLFSDRDKGALHYRAESAEKRLEELRGVLSVAVRGLVNIATEGCSHRGGGDSCKQRGLDHSEYCAACWATAVLRNTGEDGDAEGAGGAMEPGSHSALFLKYDDLRAAVRKACEGCATLLGAPWTPGTKCGTCEFLGARREAERRE